MRLGTLVRSNSHVDYLCQVYGPGEIDVPPMPADFAFGTFVRISTGGTDNDLIGLIYDTILLNPDFGNLGPRLSPAPDLVVFSPDYLTEKVTVLGIAAIGAVGGDGTVNQGVPSLSAQIGAQVERMEDEAVRQFHCLPGGSPGVRLGYAPLLLSLGSPLARHLLLSVMDRLTALFPDQPAQLSVLRGELAWQAVIGPVGGAQ